MTKLKKPARPNPDDPEEGKYFYTALNMLALWDEFNVYSEAKVKELEAYHRDIVSKWVDDGNALYAVTQEKKALENENANNKSFIKSLGSIDNTFCDHVKKIINHRDTLEDKLKTCRFTLKEITAMDVGKGKFINELVEEKQVLEDEMANICKTVDKIVRENLELKNKNKALMELLKKYENPPIIPQGD